MCEIPYRMTSYRTHLSGPVCWANAALPWCAFSIYQLRPQRSSQRREWQQAWLIEARLQPLQMQLWMLKRKCVAMTEFNLRNKLIAIKKYRESCNYVWYGCGGRSWQSFDRQAAQQLFYLVVFEKLSAAFIWKSHNRAQLWSCNVCNEQPQD